MSGFDLLIRNARLRGAAARVEIGITGDRICSHLLWLTDEAGREQVYEMVTVSAARALGIDDHRLAPGGRADRPR